MAQPLIIVYNNLLHQYGVQSSKVTEFYEEHKSDPAFARRARVLKRLFLARDKVEAPPSNSKRNSDKREHAIGGV